MPFFPVTFTGIVIDERGERLSEAIVRLLSHAEKVVGEVHADPGGRFSLRVAIEQGEYDLEVRRSGFSTAREIVEVKPGMTGRTLILMLRRNVPGAALSHSL